MPRLPLLLSIPNGGTTVPRELAPRIALSPEELYLESEPCARDLFAFGEAVQGRVEAEVARAVIDLDRDPRERPPGFPDGVVKSVTRRGVSIWTEQGFPTPEEMERLVDRHHRPFHEVLERSASRGSVRLCLDCRVLPPLTANDGSLAIFHLVNRAEGIDPTCSQELLDAMAGCLEVEFGALRPEEAPLVSVNSNGHGEGYLLRRHARGRTPWIQLHLNPRIYLQKEVVPGSIPEADRELVAGLRTQLLRTLTRFAEFLS